MEKISALLIGAVCGMTTLLCFEPPASAQQFEWRRSTPEEHNMSGAKLDALRDELVKRGTRAWLVIRNDRIVDEWYAQGEEEKKQGTASLAKALVGGLSLAIAIDDGRIALDDAAAKYIPQWKNDAKKGRITVRQLGSHTSGIADAEEAGLAHEKLTGWKGDFWKRLPPPNDPFTLARDKAPLLFKPGTRLQYSNPGIGMLTYCVTAAIHDTDHKDIRTLLKDRVMSSIGVVDSDWSAGYGSTFDVDGLPLVAAWGGGSFTPRATARIGRLLLREGDWDGKRILSKESIQAITGDAGLPGHCGMGFWTNADGRYAKLPKDTYYGAGAGDQLLIVIPSLHLIAVRNGATLAPEPKNAKDVFEAYHSQRVKILFEPLVEAVVERAAKSAEAHATAAGSITSAKTGRDYFPPPESKGGWRKLVADDEIRKVAGVDPAKLADLKEWLLKSDNRNFAAVVIRHGYVVLEVERGNSAKNDARRVASVSKAICATVLAIASEDSQKGKLPKKMSFDDPAFDFIPWAQPLSDPRKAKITVKQLLNHTSGVCPEATGAPNDGTWDYILGHSGDTRTARLAFDPGTACGYSTHAFHHAALVCENVTGKPYDQYAIETLFKPIGCEKWSFQYFDGGEKYGKHPTHGLGMPARDLARIAYCMLRGGRWQDKQVIPQWFVEQTAHATHNVQGVELRFKINAQSFSHGWELPAVRDPAGRGIPADARFKPGSGGQLISFVPSLDLVVTRQTGSSGDWQYEEYLGRACQTVLDNSAEK